MDSSDNNHAQATPEAISPASVATPQLFVAAPLAVAVVLLAVFVIVSRRRSTSKGNALLLLGPSDAGKTAILSALAYKQTLPTQTSMQTNAAIVPLSQSTLRVLDIPGHPRLRDQFREHLSDAKGIAFVVDSSTISRTGPAVAEHLHQVLHAVTSLPPSQPTPALLVVAHKCDALKATAQATPAQLAINRVRTILERELEKRRASQAGGVGVEGLGAEGTEFEFSGLERSGTSEFRFDNWEGGEVAFVGTSVKVGNFSILDEKTPEKNGLSPLCDWIEEL